MGLFGESTKESVAPNRNKREQCWDSRDTFFECLDKANIIDALDEKNQADIKKHCSSQEKKYEENCAKSWVKYFKEKRMVDHKKVLFMKEMEERGGQPLPFPISKQ